MAKRANGYATITQDGVLTEEQDTVTCGHCNGIIPILPFQNDTDSCRACDTHICTACAATLARTLKCVPFEERMTAAERVAALSRLRGGTT